MYDTEVRLRARELMDGGHSLPSISQLTGVSYATLRDWRGHPEPRRKPATCARCQPTPRLPEPAADYAYLLGLYLGDGCISAAAAARAKGVWVLRIICADAWPGLLAECQHAIAAVRPDNKVGTLHRQDGCSVVSCWSKHWPCLLPQHGPGKKHHRAIDLTPWQQTVTDLYPGKFARGLFHSDGCRFVNRVRRQLSAGDRWYEYPRYMFTNESQDILRLCGQTLDQLGVDWRFSRRNTISVARREAVARLDEHVGPKY